MFENGQIATTPAVRVEGLTVERDGRRLFSDMSWALDRGQLLAITGPSGVGKSSLLSAVTGRLPAAAGRIFRPADQTSGIIFQDLRLTKELTVLTNVLCGGLGRMNWWSTLAGFSAPERERAFDVLSNLEIDHLCHKPVRKVSGGEQQRTAIARVLFQQPGLILADEPTANLDLSLSDRVMRSIRNECDTAGSAVICVLHDTEFVDRFADAELRLGIQNEIGWEIRETERPK